MYLPERFSSLRMRKEIQGKGDYEKTNSSVGGGTGSKLQIKECKVESI